MPDDLMITESALPSLPETEDKALIRLERNLHRMWVLGRNLILAWAPAKDAVRILLVPNVRLPEIAGLAPELLRARTSYRAEAEFDGLAEFLRVQPTALACPGLDFQANRDAIDAMVRRHGVSWSEGRAVALLDIVGFSRYGEIEQVMLLNSLAYSLAVAERRCRQHGMNLNVGRSTTGDGFYLWNRSGHPDADAELLALLVVALADNAIVQERPERDRAPYLRAALTVGSHFDFHQVDDAKGRSSEHIVGYTTVTLARVIQSAEPGQFVVVPPVGAGALSIISLVARAQIVFARLEGISLGGAKLSTLRLYATGDRQPNGGFTVASYNVTDKHGHQYPAYNIKATLYDGEGRAIHVGMQSRDIVDFKSRTGPAPVADLPVSARHQLGAGIKQAASSFLGELTRLVMRK
jgi:hypothetical protein